MSLSRLLCYMGWENKNIPPTLWQWVLFSGVFTEKERREEEMLGITEAKEEHKQLFSSILSLASAYFSAFQKTAPNSVGNRNGGVAQWQGTCLAGIWPNSTRSLADSQSRLWPAPPPQCPVVLTLIWGLCEKLPPPQHSHAHYLCSLPK